jgi:hypothetical protein
LGRRAVLPVKGKAQPVGVVEALGTEPGATAGCTQAVSGRRP